ncbi:MAG: quinol oxidase [Candidatus Marsarchaeota archaeon]|nr:quinol oxidase [Candidatus Marsarchaeota archaeon]
MRRGTVIALFLVLVIVAVVSFEIQYSEYDYVGYNPVNNAGEDVVHTTLQHALGSYVGPYVTIYVTGEQWHWMFGPHNDPEVNETVVPVEEPVVFVITSVDVFHEFFVQSAVYGGKSFNFGAEAAPGYYSYIVYVFTKPGEYHVACAEYCGVAGFGLGHPWLVGTIIATYNQTYASHILGGNMPQGQWDPGYLTNNTAGGTL